MHEVLVNRLGGLSLPRKSVVRLTDRPDMTLDVYRGRKTTTTIDRNFKFGIQVHNDKLYRGIENGLSPICSSLYLFFFLSLQIFCQRYLHNCLR